MRAGRIEEQGECGEVLECPIREYTNTLLAAVPRLVVFLGDRGGQRQRGMRCI